MIIQNVYVLHITEYTKCYQSIHNYVKLHSFKENYLMKIILFVVVSLFSLSYSVASYAYNCSQCSACYKTKSCQLANYCLKQCGKKSLDRDHDGIPCENICGTTQAQFKRKLGK